MEMYRPHAEKRGKQHHKEGSGMKSLRAERQGNANNDMEAYSGPGVADGWRNLGWCEGGGLQQVDVRWRSFVIALCPLEE